MINNLTIQLKGIIKKNNDNNKPYFKKLIEIHNLYNLR